MSGATRGRPKGLEEISYVEKEGVEGKEQKDAGGSESD